MHDCYKPVKRRDALFIIGDVDQPHQSRDYERNPMMQRVSFLSIPSVLDADAAQMTVVACLTESDAGIVHGVSLCRKTVNGCEAANDAAIAAGGAQCPPCCHCA